MPARFYLINRPLYREALILTGLLLTLSSLQGADTNSPAFSRDQIDFYEKQVQPILAEHCYKCHSHQADKIKGDFLLDSREALLRGGEAGPVIVANAPEKSLLIKAVRHLDEDLKMPPKEKLPDDQIDILARWIKMGTPYSDHPAAGTKTAKKITDADRKWWSFQPVHPVQPPDIPDSGWSRNPIDKFVFAKLRAEAMRPAAEANRSTLCRRAYFDLIGLPPKPEELAAFVADKSPNAYENLIDKLLADSHYGEQQARHWLDLVRFAESDGYKLDAFRANAWRYRDYVIRSFNSDKPYDRFMMEQIAADELWPDDPEALIGVSYLRLWIYEYNQRDVKNHWATILNDITDVTGDVFLGLGMQCARCHDHKFDPILQRDYFRLQAFFAALLPRDDLPLATRPQVKAYAAQLEQWQLKTADLRAQIEEVERPVREKTTRAVLDKLPKEIQAIMTKPAAERTPYENQIQALAYRQVTDDIEKLDGKFQGQQKEKLVGLQQELAQFSEFKPQPLPSAMLVTDVGPVAPPTTIPKDKTQANIEPGFLTLLNEAPATIAPLSSAPESTGRRTALAHWLASPDNPLTARVIVNRLWQERFGRGLVATPNDFGHLGTPPTHPELLDWLANYLVQNGWSLKKLDRLIVTSAAYRQCALGSDAQFASRDPDNRLLWRQNLRRLQSDQIRDAMLRATGELNESAGGPSVDASKPRRTIYTKWLRNSRDPLLEAFDPPDPYNSTPQRNVTTTPMQSLVMLNGPYVLQRAQALARRIQELQSPNDADRIKTAYQLVYQRDPSPTERAEAGHFLEHQANQLAKSQIRPAVVEAEPMPRRSGTAAVFKPAGGQTRLQVADNPLMPQYDFTAEAFIFLRSTDRSGAPRTIVSRWDGRKDQPGWSLDISSSSSNSPTLTLELIGDTTEDGAGGYEQIVSRLPVELDTPYYVGVSVRIADSSETGVTFYLKELTAGSPLQTAHVPHKVTSNHQSNLSVVIGARDPEKHVVWDGLIDDVRLSRRALKPEELLISNESSTEGCVGYWRFESPDLLKDSSPNGHNIKAEVSPAAQLDPATAALVDLCHVLLNSNEFLYVD